MKKIPQRMCVGCRAMKPKSELIRVVKSPEGVISTDTTYKAQGRGAYICKDPECFKRAIKNKALSRTFKTAIPKDVEEAIQTALS